MDGIAIKQVARQSALELKLSGRLTMGNSGDFEKDVQDILHGVKASVLGLNLAGMDLIDSSGLSTLIRITNESKKNQVEIIFFGASPTILSVIRVARLNTLFTFTTTEDFESRFPQV